MEYLNDKQQKKHYEIGLNLLEFLTVATNFMINNVYMHKPFIKNNINKLVGDQGE